MLHIERGVNTDASIEQLEHILVALRVARARCIRVREFIDHRQTGMPGEDRIEIHLLEFRSAILDLRPRHDRHSFEQRFRFLATVCFNNADHHLASFRLFLPRGLQHGVGLAHAGRHPEENLQFAARCSPFFTLHSGKKRIWIRAFGVAHGRL